MANFQDFFKKITGGSDEDTRRPVWKKLNVMLLVAAGGILLILLANTFSTGENSDKGPIGAEPAEKQSETVVLSNTSSDIAALENTLAGKTEEILSQIEGVGDVRVTVNLASTTEKEYAVNTTTSNKETNENDQKGGVRTITEVDETGQMVLARINQGSKEEPVVVKEVKPEVRGVIVVSEGAEDPVIKAELTEAVHVYLDVPLHKVVVLSKESR